MDFQLVWAVVAFFLGAIFNRWDASRRHSAEVQAARQREFDTFQRETWLAAQGALTRYSNIVEVLANSHIHARQQPDWQPIQEPGPADPPVAPVPEQPEAMHEYQAALFELTTLQSRLADEPTREMLYEAISAVENVRWTGYRPWTSVEDIRDAQLPTIFAVSNAIERLGQLAARAPVAPSPWWDRLLGREPPSPPSLKIYRLMGPEDLEDLEDVEAFDARGTATG